MSRDGWPYRRFARSAMAVGAVGLTLILCLAAYAGGLYVSGNSHQVVPGELYRSGQPAAASLERYARDYGIRTIINLRGENAGTPWYDAEVAEAARLGIAHVDFRMSAGRELTQAEAERLIAVLRRADKPALVHCEGGADRTGLAAALYVAAVAKLGETAAERQISIRYGHVALPYLSAAYAMDRTFEALEPWLGFPDS